MKGGAIILILLLIVTPLALATPEQELLNLINNERSTKNLTKLEISNKLTTAAVLHTEDMLTKGYLDHNNSRERILKTGFNKYAGENIGAHSGRTNITKIFQLWKDSPPHYKKIINPLCDITDSDIPVIYQSVKPKVIHNHSVMVKQFFDHELPEAMLDPVLNDIGTYNVKVTPEVIKTCQAWFKNNEYFSQFVPR